MSAATGELQRPQRHTWSALLALVLLIALGATLTGIFPISQILTQRRTVELSEQKLAALVEENARLEELVEQLNSPEEIEMMARDRFGLVREGEISYVVVREPTTRAEPQPDPVPEEDPPWYKRLWNFVSGSDLPTDE